MITVYGIRNCDTCRAALKWLAEHEMDHAFHDFRKDGLEAGDVVRWVESVGWETLLNRRGTTWRKLPDADKADVDATAAIRLMADHPTLIKRPVFERDGGIAVGFGDDQKKWLAG